MQGGSKKKNIEMAVCLGGEFLLYVRETTFRGICKSPVLREKEADWTCLERGKWETE